MFCRETIGDLRSLVEKHDDFPPVLFVFQGSTEDAGPIFEELWPEARGVSDMDLTLYHAFGLGRGNMKQMLGPRVWKRAWQARRKGYRQGKAVTDPWLMPGAFLIEDGEIVWEHDYAHAGDSPDFLALRGRTRRQPLEEKGRK